MDPAWYCIRSQPKHEHIAAASLRQLGVEVFNPQVRIRRSTKRGLVHFVESVFPNYLFARFILSQMLEKVKFARGVSSVVHFGEKVPTVPNEVIDSFRESIQSRPEVAYTELVMEGEEVEICAGPFEGQAGLVAKILPARQRIQVLLDVMGRSTSIEISLDAILLPRSNPASVVPELVIQ